MVNDRHISRPLEYLQRNKEMEILCLGGGGGNRTVGSVVHKQPAFGHKSDTCPVVRTGSSHFNIFGPLKNYLYGKRFATDPHAKLAVLS